MRAWTRFVRVLKTRDGCDTRICWAGMSGGIWGSKNASSIELLLCCQLLLYGTHHDTLRLCVTTSRLSLCIHVDIICNGHASTASYLLRFGYTGGLMTSAAVKRKKKRTHVLHNYLGGYKSKGTRCERMHASRKVIGRSVSIDRSISIHHQQTPPTNKPRI